MKKLRNTLIFYYNLLLFKLNFHVTSDPALSLKPLGRFGAHWWVPTALLPQRAMCYTAGVGEDVSFDHALIDQLHARVFAFDPTPRAITFAAKHTKRGFRFFPIGLWSRNSRQKFFTPSDPTMVSHSILNLQETSEYFMADCKKLKTVMTQLRHTKIDLLKLDIEGAEHEVLADMLRSKIYPRILCVEFDQPALFKRIKQTVLALQKAGYTIIKTDFFNMTLLHHENPHRL
jgi:FkbM family methyltransferase